MADLTAIKTTTPESTVVNGLTAPFPQWDPAVQGRRTDQGWDLQAAPNTPVLAAASGHIVYMHDPSGFGQDYPVLMLDTPWHGQTAIYYGHIAPAVADGTHVAAGEAIGKTLQTPGGNASASPGWLEIGFWGPNGPTGDGAAAKAAFGAASVADAGTTAAPSGFSGSQGAGTAADVPYNPTQNYAIDPADEAWVKQNAGQDTWMLAVPELANILGYVAHNQITDSAEVNSLISQTDWYKTHSADQRSWAQLYASDPQEAAREIHQAQMSVQQMAGQLGVTLTQDQLNTLSIDSKYYGLTPAELQAAVGQYSSTKAPSANLATLQAAANNYLVPISDTTMQQWLTQINSGISTTEQFDAYLKDMAVSKFPWMSQAIQAGQTPSQVLEPYKQSIGATLQVDPNTINFNDPRWAKLTYTTDPKTGMQTQVPLWQSEQMVKQDPNYGWQHTPDGRNQASQAAMNLTRLMGAVA